MVRSLSMIWLLIAALISSRLGESALPAENDIRRDAGVRAVEAVLPSVVNISTETVVEVQDPIGQLFREFFGPYYRRQPDAHQSLGSGVIIDDSGYILTNFHVVQRAHRITVTLWDGREFEAQPVVATRQNDVALLKLITQKPEKFTAIQFAADDDLILGETVLALGNPFGLGESVSRGILSSKARRPKAEGQSLDIADWIQTDAAINPGNSGGPLVNLRGELIGINVAIYREGQGIGFAIPVKRISETLAEIFTPEGVKSLWFGAHLRSGTHGVTVLRVDPNSPAHQAGLQPDDLLTDVNGKKPKNLIELNRELFTAGEKRPVSLGFTRGRERKTVQIRLVPESEVFTADLIRRKTGANVQALSRDLAAALKLDTTDGLLVSGTERVSPAEAAGLERGHVILSIDQIPIQGIVPAAKILYGKAKGEKVVLGLVIQRARRGYVEVYRANAQLTVR